MRVVEGTVSRDFLPFLFFINKKKLYAQVKTVLRTFFAFHLCNRISWKYEKVCVTVKPVFIWGPRESLNLVTLTVKVIKYKTFCPEMIQLLLTIILVHTYIIL